MSPSDPPREGARDAARPDDERFVSTGELPPSPRVIALVEEAWRRFGGVRDGAVSQVYPALARADPALFGLCVVGTDGATAGAGDADHEFTIMSVAKPFVFAVLCDALGVETARDAVGVDATGRPFDSLAAIEADPGGRTNPMVNAGAIATTSFVGVGSPAARWATILDALSRFAGRALRLDDEVVASAAATNHRNRAIVALLDSVGRLGSAPDVSLDLYTRQSCVLVTATDLAVMGATLADGGVNPRTGEAVVSAESCRAALAVMAIAGMYERSGRWFFDVGLPAKSGIGGGLVTVSPGKGGLGAFSPPLDASGNSVRGQLATAFLSRRLGLDLLASSSP